LEDDNEIFFAIGPDWGGSKNDKADQKNATDEVTVHWIALDHVNRDCLSVDLKLPGRTTGVGEETIGLVITGEFAFHRIPLDRALES
jgi:hypothetical protein